MSANDPHPAGSPADPVATRPGAEETGYAVDRAAAFAAGPAGIPRKFLYWVLGAAVVLSLGGLLGEHLFSSAGLNPVANPTPSSPPTTQATIESVPTPSVPDRAVGAPLAGLMGLTTLRPRLAPPFTLPDQLGRATKVPSDPPSVVVLTFFDGPCNDICPVMAAEIERADTDLGPTAARVQFLTVNTDPTALTTSDQAPAVSATGLGTLANWHMVTGPLGTLNSIWKSYGLSISVDKKSGLEAHNDVVYFIDPKGNLRYRATPFADESSTGRYSLPAATVARWGQGIANYAERLAGQ